MLFRVTETRLKPLTLILFFTLLLSFGQAQQAQTLKLPPGKIVRVLGVAPITFTQGPPALMVRYETDLKVSDKGALRKEADEVWSFFKNDAENAHYQSSVVSAIEKPTGLLFKTSSGYNFVYQKRADNQWHCLEDDKK